MTDRQRLAQKNRDKAYGLLVNSAIGENHQYGEEFAILRKAIDNLYTAMNLTPPTEFSEYNTEAENTKNEVKEYLDL